MSEWQEDCMRWHGRVLVGARRHWCPDWDYLPIDDTCPEFEACTCAPIVEPLPPKGDSHD